MTMIGLDVTHQALITDEHTERLARRGRVGKIVAELIDFYSRFHRRMYPDLAGSPIHDPVAVAHVLAAGPRRDAAGATSTSTAAGSRGAAARTSTGAAGRARSRTRPSASGDRRGMRFARALLIVARIASLG